MCGGGGREMRRNEVLKALSYSIPNDAHRHTASIYNWRTDTLKVYYILHAYVMNCVCFSKGNLNTWNQSLSEKKQPSEC